MHDTTLSRLPVIAARQKTRDQSMNAVATGNLSSSDIASDNIAHDNVMPLATTPNRAAKLITRELTLQRNRNRVLAASQQDLLNEIARLRQENADLERLACIDNLTGVFNRHMLMQEIRRSMNTFGRHNTPAVMLLIDLNGFKQINADAWLQAADLAMYRTKFLQRRRQKKFSGATE
jgi:PleD family two-component response regulator